MPTPIVVQLMLNAQQYFAGLQQAAGATQTFASNVSGATKNVSSFASNANSAAKSSNTLFESFANGAKTAATLAVRFAGMYVAVGALKSVVSAGIDEFVKLDTNLRNVQSITLQSDGSLDQLRKTLIGTVLGGQSFGRSASELAGGMYELVSAGYSTAEALSIVKVAAEGGAAGLTDTATSSKLLLGILQAYHLPATAAKETMDQLFTIVDLGVVHFNDLATSMGYVIPTAAALHIPIEEVGAAIELLTRQGQMPSRTMTNLNAVMSKLLKPTQSLATAIKQIGFESGEAAVKQVGFVEVVRRLSILAGDSDSKLAAWFGDIRAIRGILPLAANDGMDFVNMLRLHNEEIALGDRTDKAFAEQQKSISYQWSEMAAKLRAVVALIATGLTPSIVTILTKINDGISTFTDFTAAITGSSDAMAFFKGAVIALVAATAIPRLISLFSGLVSALTSSGISTRLALAAMGDFKTALTGLHLAMPALMIAIGLLYLAMEKLGQLGTAHKAIEEMDAIVRTFTKTFESAQQNVSKGLLSPEAFNLLEVSHALETIDKLLKNTADGLKALSIFNPLDAADTLSRMAHLDFRSSADVIQDKYVKSLEKVSETVASMGDLRAIKALFDNLHSQVDKAAADYNALAAKIGTASSFQKEFLARSPQAQYMNFLMDAQQAVGKQMDLVKQTEQAHRKVTIATHQTTEEIGTANDRLEGVTAQVAAWAANLKPVMDSLKAITTLMSPQKAAQDAKIAGIKAEIAEHELLVDAVKDTGKEELAALNREKDVRKATTDIQEASINQEKRSLEARKEGLAVFDATIAKLEKQKEALGKTSEAMKQLDDAMLLLHDRQNLTKNDVMNGLNDEMTVLRDKLAIASGGSKEGIQKEIDALQKKIDVERLNVDMRDISNRRESDALQKQIDAQKILEDTKAIADRKATEALQKQIDLQKTAKDRLKERLDLEEDALKKKENSLQQQKEADRIANDATEKQMDAIRERERLGDPILQNLKQQLAHEEALAAVEETRTKALEASTVAIIASKLAQQGMIASQGEINFLIEAMPAIMDKDVAKVQELADKYQIPIDRVQELITQSTAFSKSELKPKIDMAPIVSLENKLSGISAMVIKPIVDASSIEAFVASLGSKGTWAGDLFEGFARAQSLFIPSAKHYAEGGLITSPTFGMMGEGNRQELVLPLTRPARAQSLLNSLSPSVLGRIMPNRDGLVSANRGNMRGDTGGGGSTVHRPFNNYGTIVLDRRADHTMDTDILLQRMVS